MNGEPDMDLFPNEAERHTCNDLYIEVGVLFHHGRQHNSSLTAYVTHMFLKRGASCAAAWGGLLGDALNRRVPAHRVITPRC